MQNLFEQARALGEAVRNSHEGVKLQNARDALNNDSSALQKLQDYVNFQQLFASELKEGKLDETEKQSRMSQQAYMLDALKADKTVGPVIQAENEFFALAGNVMNVYKSTVEGKTGAESSCASGCESCAGCGG